MKTLKEFYGDVQEKSPVKPKQSVIQRYKALSRRMKQIARKSSTKMKKKRALTRRRDDGALLKSAQKQAKNMVIKKQLGPDVKYNELPLQKRIQINQKIVAKKAKLIQKISKKLLRKLKAGEGERIKKNRAAQSESFDERSGLKRAYDDIVKDYSDMVQKGGGKHSNSFYLSRVANNYGIDSIKPVRDYVDSLIKDKKLSKDLTPYNEEYEINEKIEGLVNKAKKSGMPYGILKKVYDRGMAAYKTGHRPGTTSQQWAFARVNSFITKSSGTWGKADKDLAKQVRGEGVKQDKDIKDREGTQPAKYYAKDADGDEMSTSTKKARARHFAKNKKGPAPGDKSADTKPSVHTKKFKQMYGEKK